MEIGGNSNINVFLFGTNSKFPNTKAEYLPVCKKELNWNFYKQKNNGAMSRWVPGGGHCYPLRCRRCNT